MGYLSAFRWSETWKTWLEAKNSQKRRKGLCPNQRNRRRTGSRSSLDERRHDARSCHDQVLWRQGGHKSRNKRLTRTALAHDRRDRQTDSNRIWRHMVVHVEWRRDESCGSRLHEGGPDPLRIDSAEEKCIDVDKDELRSWRYNIHNSEDRPALEMMMICHFVNKLLFIIEWAISKCSQSPSQCFRLSLVFTGFLDCFCLSLLKLALLCFTLSDCRNSIEATCLTGISIFAKLIFWIIFCSFWLIFLPLDLWHPAAFQVQEEFSQLKSTHYQIGPPLSPSTFRKKLFGVQVLPTPANNTPKKHFRQNLSRAD